MQLTVDGISFSIKEEVRGNGDVERIFTLKDGKEIRLTEKNMASIFAFYRAWKELKDV